MPRQYESPQVKILGTVTDLTMQKPGVFFDFPGALLGSKTAPPPGTPGTFS